MQLKLKNVLFLFGMEIRFVNTRKTRWQASVCRYTYHTVDGCSDRELRRRRQRRRYETIFILVLLFGRMRCRCATNTEGEMYVPYSDLRIVYLTKHTHCSD